MRNSARPIKRASPCKPAVNGIGWGIQHYTYIAGWQLCTAPMSHDAAVAALAGYDKTTHRVFEALKS